MFKKGNKIGVTHGKRNTRLYCIWVSMKQRCYNKNNKDFVKYGSRGIKICDEWLNNFMSFYNWSMENSYKEDLTIDRINNNGNYEPSNCRWITQKAQTYNIRRNRYYTYKNHTLTIEEMPKHRHGIRTSASSGGQVDNMPWGAALAAQTTNTEYTGGGQAHNNVQPSEVDNWIIKAF